MQAGSKIRLPVFGFVPLWWPTLYTLSLHSVNAGV
jgi:hypothetical protein